MLFSIGEWECGGAKSRLHEAFEMKVFYVEWKKGKHWYRYFGRGLSLRHVDARRARLQFNRLLTGYPDRKWRVVALSEEVLFSTEDEPQKEIR